MTEHEKRLALASKLGDWTGKIIVWGGVALLVVLLHWSLQ